MQSVLYYNATYPVTYSKLQNFWNGTNSWYYINFELYVDNKKTEWEYGINKLSNIGKSIHTYLDFVAELQHNAQ